MTFKEFAAGAATAGVLGLAAIGVGAGLAQADPPDNPWPPIPGPGVNAGEPGNPLPPGRNFLPPPGHGGPMPQDRIEFSAPPWWLDLIPPLGIPPQPPLPDWADGLKVVWNPEIGAWGVWDASSSVFIRL